MSIFTTIKKIISEKYSAHKVDMVLFNCRDPLLRFRCDRFEVVVVKVSITGRCDVPPP